MAVTQQSFTAHGADLGFEKAFHLIQSDKKHRQSKHVQSSIVGQLNGTWHLIYP